MTTIVTINTDASYHPEENVGAFAFWIVYQGQRTIQSGPLKDPVNTHDCELKCIANALHAVNRLNYAGVSKIIVNTDSHCSIDAIRKVGKKTQHYFERQAVAALCRRYIRELKKKYKSNGKTAFVEFRKVKAHSANDTSRNYVNNYLDQAAKKEMRKQISKK
jgi:ribonuclease HI